MKEKKEQNIFIKNVFLMKFIRKCHFLNFLRRTAPDCQFFQEKLLAVKLLTELRKIKNFDDQFTYSVPLLNGIQSYLFKISVSKIVNFQSLFCHENLEAKIVAVKIN